jgi:hypothetical protein
MPHKCDDSYTVFFMHIAAQQNSKGVFHQHPSVILCDVPVKQPTPVVFTTHNFLDSPLQRAFFYRRLISEVNIKKPIYAASIFRVLISDVSKPLVSSLNPHVGLNGSCR